MAVSEDTRILATLQRDDFLGRDRELGDLVNAVSGDDFLGKLLSAKPGIGLTELMKQVYDELFRRRLILPIYFELRPSDETAERAASRFLLEFFVQSLAFLRSDPEIIAAAPPISELAELGRPVGGWYVNALEQLTRTNREVSIKSLLSAPVRAVTSGVRCVLMIDGADQVLSLEGGQRLIESFNDLPSKLPAVIGAKRRFNKFTLGLDHVRLDDLPFADSFDVVARKAARAGVLINDQTRDLTAVQFNGDLVLINYFLNGCSAADRDLQSFKKFSGSYVREVVTGEVGSRLDQLLERVLPDRRHRRDLIENLYYGVVRNERLIWEKPDDISPDEFRKAEELLDVNEIINAHPGQPLSDYVTARHRSLVENRTTSVVVSELVTSTLKRAPQIMARHYRRISSLNLKGLLESFDSQEVPSALIDYGQFKRSYKGLSDLDILQSLQGDLDIITLPQIAHVDNAAEFYPPIGQVTDVERAVVGVGFIDRSYTDEAEVAWLAVEIDSKLEAERDVAEFWCDRLDVVALSSGFRTSQIWLVSPEGFTDGALEALRIRGAYGSSRKQVELLNRYIAPDAIIGDGLEKNEFEIVVPMGEDTELIAAHAVEEVAKRSNFTPKAINQIKTALVEACINAAEHSLSPERKIYQKFVVDKNKIVITVSNRGIRMSDRVGAVNEPGTGRRGWGLNLMKGLMDEVKIEQVDDGTRISMTKYLQ
jgi:serine/threonine-protein kinase RsbW